MKYLVFKKFLLLILYTLVNLYFMVFNWKVFILVLKVDLGFAVVSIPPFIVFFLLGFLIIGILSWMGYLSHIQKIISELEQGMESGSKDDVRVREKIREQLLNEEIINTLKEKIGIQEIAARQEELARVIKELKNQAESG